MPPCFRLAALGFAIMLRLHWNLGSRSKTIKFQYYTLTSSFCICSPNEIIKSGQAYGAQPEDICGCLYFFLSDQLRTFAKRIRELDVTFRVFNTAAHTLAGDISGGQYTRYGLTPSVRFDRIDLAHTLADSGDMRDVLKSWTPLLAPGDTTAIVGVFSDWTNVQKDGSVVGADEVVVASIVGKLIKLGRVINFYLSCVYPHSHMTVAAWNDIGRCDGHGKRTARRSI